MTFPSTVIAHAAAILHRLQTVFIQAVPRMGRNPAIFIHNSPFPANTATGPNARYALQRRRDYESNRHCQTGGRPGKNCHSKGDPKNPAYPGGRPVADIIDTVGKILLFYVGFSQKTGVVVVHNNGNESGDRRYPR